MDGTALFQGPFIGGHIVTPELAFPVVTLTNLAVLSQIIEPLLETAKLLILADMKKEFENMRAVVRQLFLERVDVVVPLGPNLFWDQIVHSHH
jgi:hypothetical protein